MNSTKKESRFYSSQLTTFNKALRPRCVSCSEIDLLSGSNIASYFPQCKSGKAVNVDFFLKKFTSRLAKWEK